MPGLIAAIPPLFAQAAQNAGGGANASPSYLTFLPTIALVAFWFWLIMIRPQQKQDRERKAMLTALKKNDKVLTSGGMYATVVSVDENQDRVVLRIDDDRGVKVAFTKASVARVLDPADRDKDSSKEKEKAAETA